MLKYRNLSHHAAANTSMHTDNTKLHTREAYNNRLLHESHYTVLNTDFSNHDLLPPTSVAIAGIFPVVNINAWHAHWIT